MAQYIDKSALVAKIKEYMKTYNKGYADGDDRRADALEVLLHNIDTLEVKDVELEEECERIWTDLNTLEYRMSKDDLCYVAKHFFVLGLNTQHSSINIPNIDALFEEDGIDPNSKEAKVFKESYYMALERLKEGKGE